MQGDCLERMKEIPDGSVDLILTDPPYGTMKGLDGVDHGMSGKTGWDEALDPAEFLEHCNRVLRMNGALILFSQEPYTSKLVTEAHNNVPFSYRMVWTKDHFANGLIAKKAPVSYFEDILVFFKKYDLMGQHPMREYSLKVFNHCGGNLGLINKNLGHRRAEHFFYVDSTQFGLCTEKTYNELIQTYGFDKEDWYLPFNRLVDIDLEFKDRFKRVFNLSPGKKIKSNVLNYKKDYSGFHPTQKPVALLEDLITTYSNEDQTVLDFTMGSGSTGVACVNTNRSFIGIEMDENYFQIAKERIESAQQTKEENI